MRGKKLHYYLPNLLLTALLTFALLGETIIILFFNVILRPDTYTDQMYKNEVDKIAFEEINDYFDKQYNYSGVSPEVFKNAVKQKDISAAIYAYVDSTFEYMSGKTGKLPEFEYDFTPLEESLHKDYEDWAKEHNKEFDDKLKAMEKKTVDNVEKYVRDRLDIMMLSSINKENGISTKIRNTVGFIRTLQWILLGVIAALVGLMLLLNRKHITYVLYWSGSAFFAGGLLLIIPTAVLKITKYFDGLVIRNQSIYKAIIYSLYSVTDKTLICGVILAVLSAVLMFLFAAYSKNMFKFRYNR